MAIDPRYLEYLAQFRETVPVGRLHDDPQRRSAVALRHDVDYDLDVALEMAWHEWRRGFAASYYLLPTAAYWQDPRLLAKCLQLQDFGHEVGLHVNLLASWVRREIEDPGRELARLLAPLRAGGVAVRGVSSHGDRLCYTQGFNNYWCFGELRPARPEVSESGRTAEGPRPADAAETVPYPSTHALTREDGARFDLWSVSMAEHGLEYEAFHVPFDAYYSDSGGSWRRSPDPLSASLRGARVQVLMHPVHWRGPQRLFLFLSTARAGTRWLASYLDRGSSLTARHEFLLNHESAAGGPDAPPKRTGEGFADLLGEPDAVRRLLIEGRAILEDAPGDQAEVNVYLEPVLAEVREVFPDAVLVGVERDAARVVRSLLERDWYATPEDRRHPPMEVDGWDSLSQFEKTCWYVHETQESVRRAAVRVLRFEEIVDSPDRLAARLAELDVAVFPRLASAEHARLVNATESWTVPPPERWPAEWRAVFERICGTGEGGVARRWWRRLRAAVARLRRGADAADPLWNRLLEVPAERPTETLAEVDYRAAEHDEPAVRNARWEGGDEGLRVDPSGSGHAHVLLGGGSWHELDRGGWKNRIGCFYRCDVELGEGHATLYCLMFDAAGALARKRALGRVDAEDGPRRFAFRVRSDLPGFNLALYMPEQSLPESLLVRRFRLELVPMAPPRLGRPRTDRRPV